MEGFVPKNQSPPSYGTPAVFFAIVGIVLLFLGLYGYLHRRTVAEQASVEVAVPEATVPPRAPSPARENAANRGYAIPVKNAFQTPPSNGAAPAPAGISPEVSLEYDLVTRDVLDRLTQNGDGRVSIGQYGVTIVPQFREKFEGIHSDPGFHPLDSESRPLNLNEPSTIFRGGREPKTNEAIGLTIESTYTKAMEPAGGEYHVTIKRALPDYSSPAESKVNVQTNDETLHIPDGAAAVLTGILSRKTTFAEGEEDLYRGNVLRAFLEPSFQRGDDDLILIFAPLPHSPAQNDNGGPGQLPAPPPLPEQNFLPPSPQVPTNPGSGAPQN